jgi:hypothetical protein
MNHNTHIHDCRKLAEALQRQIARQLSRTLELTEDPRTGFTWLRREDRDGRYTVRTSICVMRPDRIEMRCLWHVGAAWRFDGAWGLVDNCNPRAEGRSSAGFRTPDLEVSRRSLGWASSLCELVGSFSEVARGLHA